MVDLALVRAHLGLSWKGHPETPVTKQTWDKAVADGVVRQITDANGPATAPTWAEIQAAHDTASTTNRRSELGAIAYDEAARRRRATLAAMHPEVSSNAQISDEAVRSRIDAVLAINTARVRREAKGSTGESAKLDAAEALADAVQSIETALDTVYGKTQDDTYTTPDQVTGAREWP